MGLSEIGFIKFYPLFNVNSNIHRCSEKQTSTYYTRDKHQVMRQFKTKFRELHIPYCFDYFYI